MRNTMSPFERMTAGQIGKLEELFGAGLRKAGLPSEKTQQVIETRGGLLAGELVAVVRKHVEAVSNAIVRCVKVNRTRTPQEALDATGRAQHTDRSVVNAMPHGEGEEAEVEFFKLDMSARNGYISDDDLEKEFESRGYSRPADPYELSAVNEDDPAFADDYPNATHWKDSDGKWCFAAFRRWDDGKRGVSVRRHDRDWDVNWWFAGVRK